MASQRADLVISIKSRPSVTWKCCQTPWYNFFVIQIGLTICATSLARSYKRLTAYSNRDYIKPVVIVSRCSIRKNAKSFIIICSPYVILFLNNMHAVGQNFHFSKDATGASLDRIALRLPCLVRRMHAVGTNFFMTHHHHRSDVKQYLHRGTLGIPL